MGGRLKCPICETPLIAQSEESHEEWYCPEPSCGAKLTVPPQAIRGRNELESSAD